MTRPDEMAAKPETPVEKLGEQLRALSNICNVPEMS
jgi:hypothetical protein